MRRNRPPSTPSPMARFVSAVVLIGALGALAPSPRASEPSALPEVQQGAEVGPPVTPFSFDGDVRTLPPPPAWKAGDPVKFIPKRDYPVPDAGVAQPQPFAEDPLLEAQREAAPLRHPTGFATPILNIAGQGYTGAAPPDTVGDVGPSHYIQATNGGGGTAVNIFSKSGSLMASFTLDSLGSGSCASGMGDPIVLYDRQADRWMISEFSGSGNYLCVYVSKSGDPVSGGWWNYGFQCPAFPDYPKYSVWSTDANGGQGSYIVTANDGGPGVYALDRGKMLAGQASTFQRFVTAAIPGFGFQGLYAPADVDGASAPPARTPAIVMTKRDTENNQGPTGHAGDVLQMYEFQVNWTTPASTTLTGPLYVDIADFDATICGLTTWDCIPQPGTSNKLDPLREPVMQRLQYWNHGTYESLVGNFTVDANGSDLAGIRWFELRRTSGSWAPFVQGTYAPDSVYRWMGSAAADQTGNIALAYSVSDASSVYPSLRYTGRQFDDPAGVMTQGEGTIATGDSAQGFNRWGDYAAMGVDPADDCTFWFTSEYMAGGSWHTEIAAFKFDRCGCLAVPPAPSAHAETDGDNRVEVTWDDNSQPGIVRYEVRRADAATGPFATVATVSDTSPGTGSGAGYVWTDTTVSGGSTYYYAVLADDGLACLSPLSVPAAVTATGMCTLAPAFGGLATASNYQNGTCGIHLAWTGAISRCAGQVLYNVYRSTDPQFTPAPANRVAAGVSGSSYTDRDGLVYGTTYSYVVRAWDPASGQEESNLNRKSDVSTGPTTETTPLSENFSGAAVPSLPTGWAQTFVSGAYGTNYWGTLVKPARPSAAAHSSPNTLQFKVYRTTAPGFQARVYRTASLSIPASALTATVGFWMYHDNLKQNYVDTVQVQALKDGDTNWVNVGAPVKRYMGEPFGWQQHVVDLISLKGYSLKIGFLGTAVDNELSGNDIHLDDITVTVVDGSSCVTLPGEVSPGRTRDSAQLWTGPSTMSWQAPVGAVDRYRLCRGTQADLPKLLTSETDAAIVSCGTATQATGLTEDPGPVAGRFYWYLVVGESGGVVGPAGSATAGDRVLNASGACP